MSATEGFWPGEAPPATEEKDVQEPDATVAEPEPLGWPQPHEEEPEAEAEPEPEAEQASAEARAI